MNFCLSASHQRACPRHLSGLWIFNMPPGVGMEMEHNIKFDSCFSPSHILKNHG